MPTSDDRPKFKSISRSQIFRKFTKKFNMIIERTTKEIVFRLPSSTRLEDLQEIANLFSFKEVARKSKATQKGVDELVKKIKKGRWVKTKTKIGL